MFAVVLTSLSKVFDCVLHDLIIAKIKAYGFNFTAARLTQSYLSNREKRTNTNKRIGYGRKSVLVFCRVLYWDHFYLVPSCVICF